MAVKQRVKWFEEERSDAMRLSPGQSLENMYYLPINTYLKYLT